MKKDSLTTLLLLLIAMALIAIAIRPYVAPETVQAQSGSAYPYYIEPGTQLLRSPDGTKQVYGRVIVDMRTGKIWGFPTIGQDVYPYNSVDPKPQTSHPFYLGKFAFEDADK
jgi:hypothetical protein